MSSLTQLRSTAAVGSSTFLVRLGLVLSPPACFVPVTVSLLEMTAAAALVAALTSSDPMPPLINSSLLAFLGLSYSLTHELNAPP